MRKICFISTVSKSIEWFFLENACFMAEHGFEVYIICDIDHQFEGKIPKNIKYIPVRIKRGISLSGILSLIKLMHVFRKQKFDVVQYTTLNASLYSSIAAFLSKVPIRVYRQWGIRFTGFSGIKRKIFFFIEKMTCAFSTHILPDSKSNLDMSRKMKLYSERKSQVILFGSASGVNLNKFNLQNKYLWKNEMSTNHFFNNDKYKIGYVGRIVRDKGIEELINAFKKVQLVDPECKLVLIGYYDDNHELNQETINYIDTDESILVTGYTDSVQKYLSAVDCMVLPSYREGFGSVILEAFALKVPVVATNINGPKDIITHNKDGLLCNVKDSDDLAIKIIQLKNSAELVNVLTENAFSKVVQDYDSMKYNQANYDLIESMLGEE